MSGREIDIEGLRALYEEWQYEEAGEEDFDAKAAALAWVRYRNAVADAGQALLEAAALVAEIEKMVETKRSNPADPFTYYEWENAERLLAEAERRVRCAGGRV